MPAAGSGASRPSSVAATASLRVGMRGARRAPHPWPTKSDTPWGCSENAKSERSAVSDQLSSAVPSRRQKNYQYCAKCVLPDAVADFARIGSSGIIWDQLESVGASARSKAASSDAPKSGQHVACSRASMLIRDRLRFPGIILDGMSRARCRELLDRVLAVARCAIGIRPGEHRPPPHRLTEQIAGIDQFDPGRNRGPGEAGACHCRSRFPQQRVSCLRSGSDWIGDDGYFHYHNCV